MAPESIREVGGNIGKFLFDLAAESKRNFSAEVLCQPTGEISSAKVQVHRMRLRTTRPYWHNFSRLVANLQYDAVVLTGGL
jgi:hypothetical protein